MEKLVPITSFGDAVAEAFALADQFRQAHAAIALDEVGEVLDTVVFAAPDHTPDEAVAWAADVQLPNCSPARLLLISVGRKGIKQARETDIARFGEVRSAFADRGCALLDHIFCDGDMVRSLAFTVGAGTWDEEGLPATRPLR